MVKVTWDGHSGSMARTQQAAQANITLQEQIEAIHKAKGLVPEDDTKDKIGPSKPELPQLPSLSSASNSSMNAPPITSLPRPPVSLANILRMIDCMAFTAVLRCSYCEQQEGGGKHCCITIL